MKKIIVLLCLISTHVFAQSGIYIANENGQWGAQCPQSFDQCSFRMIDTGFQMHVSASSLRIPMNFATCGVDNGGLKDFQVKAVAKCAAEGTVNIELHKMLGTEIVNPNQFEAPVHFYVRFDFMPNPNAVPNTSGGALKKSLAIPAQGRDPSGRH